LVNICEPLINVVTYNKPKETDRLEPKGKGTGIEIIYFSIADVAPSAKRWNLTLSIGNCAERGKPVFLP